MIYVVYYRGKEEERFATLEEAFNYVHDDLKDHQEIQGKRFIDFYEIHRVMFGTSDD